MNLDEEIVQLNGIRQVDYRLFEYLAMKAGWESCPKCGFMTDPRHTAGYMCRCLSPDFSGAEQ